MFYDHTVRIPVIKGKVFHKKYNMSDHLTHYAVKDAIA